MSDKTESLAAALAALQQKLPTIKKSERAVVETKTGGSYSYTYADLANISEQVLPLLGELGLSFIARPTFSGDRFVLAYSLLHVSGQRENGEYPLPTGGTPQAVGSAITYGRRYCLCAVTGVAPEEDDDAAHAEAEAQGQRGTAQRANAAQRRAQPAAQGKTVQRRTAGGKPPLPGEPETASPGQVGIIVTGFDKLGVADRGDRLRWTSTLVGRQLGSARELTTAEAHRLIDILKTAAEQDNPFTWLNQQVEDGADG